MRGCGSYWRFDGERLGARVRPNLDVINTELAVDQPVERTVRNQSAEHDEQPRAEWGDVSGPGTVDGISPCKQTFRC